MIKISSNAQDAAVRLGKFAADIKGPGRFSIFNRSAYRVSELVRRYLRRLGGFKHFTANELGAQPTHHIETAARDTVHHATPSYGEVVIPSPGFSRAFHEVEIRPRDAQALTIPAAAESYGKRASVLSALGWQIFRPKGKRVLMGSMKGDEAKVLYFLCSSVRQRQDRTLLPDDRSIQEEAAAGAIAAIEALQRKAS